ncbi:MAG: hypothetical protein JSW34_05130 [Candidatus Zixiibacteriota bacterium]|nr:MAG: hypothetical protein JSW34_05130 [candidate division Zixibacteria bacterium]
MKYHKRFLISLIVVSGSLAAGAAADEYDGTIRVGYQYLDHDGNRSVDRSTFNLYEGVELSLERFAYRLDNGLNLSADIRNAALGNRNLSLGATRAGQWGVGFYHNSYRRLYDFVGDVESRRYRSGGQVWWRARPWLKAHAGVGVTKKNGDTMALFDVDDIGAASEVDYAHWTYHAGLTFKGDRKTAQVEYRGSDYTDNESLFNDRSTRRLRVAVSTPAPVHRNLMLNAGYQHYRLALERRPDTLMAQTLWGGARFHCRGGYTARYSFIFDRARRTGDLTDADNITHAFYLGKAFRRHGGLTVGYRYRINDDALDELTGTGYFVTAWLRPIQNLKLRSGYGSDELSVDEGRTLTGETERSRGWFSVRYKNDYGWIRGSIQNRQTSNDDIGSSTDYLRLAADLSIERPEYGSLAVTYSYGTGEYKNSAGYFEYEEHSVSGDLTSREYQGATVGFGGTYVRNRKNLDIERFSLRFSGQYRFEKVWTVHLAYRSHNFDNYNDPSPLYSEYYSNNVVQISLSYDL